MALEALRLGHDGAVVLDGLVRHDCIGFDGIHLTALGGHVSPLSSTVLGHIDGQEDIAPHWAGQKGISSYLGREE